MTLVTELVLVALGTGILLATVRLVKGPTLPDRVIAVDLVASLSVATLAVCSIVFDQPSLLQPALVLALVAFLGTVAFARFVEKGNSQ
jgi:multicomponent Na+:H+ antiporter subunit F